MYIMTRLKKKNFLQKTFVQFPNKQRSQKNEPVKRAILQV